MLLPVNKKESGKLKDVVIIGGGLAGLVNAIQLADAGLDVTLIERKSYPFHRVCGEYISYETLPFLNSIDAFPAELAPADISQFQLSSPTGKQLQMPLDMGGFGISRYKFDEFLYKKAITKGADFLLNTKVNSIDFENETFTIKLEKGQVIQSKIVIGAFGKRSNLDKELDREFFKKRSPYIGVKYHIKTGYFPKNTIALHNFKDGYCGINAIEDEKVCLCYLTTRENLKTYGNIPELEQKVLFKNPFLKEIFTNSEYLYEKPEVINEISFAQKSAVDNHILMSGDAAGMITPLCGNGMAMAIHSAKILSEKIIDYFHQHQNRQKLEKDYTREWNNLFAKRLWTGRKIQSLFGKKVLSEFAVSACRNIKPLAKFVMQKTHGKAF